MENVDLIFEKNLKIRHRELAILQLEILQRCIADRTWPDGERTTRLDFKILKQVFHARREGRFIPEIDPVPIQRPECERNFRFAFLTTVFLFVLIAYFLG